jgi:hypothetical protein
METLILTSMMEKETNLTMKILKIKEESVAQIRLRKWRHIKIHKILKKNHADNQISGYNSFGTSW